MKTYLNWPLIRLMLLVKPWQSNGQEQFRQVNLGGSWSPVEWWNLARYEAVKNGCTIYDNNNNDVIVTQYR